MATILDVNALSSGFKLSPDIEQYPEGIIVPIDKPYKWTSADVVRKLKYLSTRFFQNRKLKIGHAGTLDPLATGVLLVCIGKATKLAESLQAEKKEYIAGVRFGATTPCYDLEKEVDATFPYEHITEEGLRKALEGFVGEQDQIPPLFSAKLIDGRRAYVYARAGEQKEMKPAHIHIYATELLKYEAPDSLIRVECSKGTYIRSFARDLGLTMESGAHLYSLERTVSGQFNVKNCIKVEDFETFLK